MTRTTRSVSLRACHMKAAPNRSSHLTRPRSSFALASRHVVVASWSRGRAGEFGIRHRRVPGVVRVFYSPKYVISGYAFDTTRKARWIADSLVESPIPGIELAEPV